MAEEPATTPSTSFSDDAPSLDSSIKQSQVPAFGGLKSSNGNIPALPFVYPVLVPGLFPPPQDQEQINRGPGLYAVPILPYMQPMSGFPSNTLIPFTYNVPTQRSSSETTAVGGEQGQAGEQPQQQQQAGAQRQVVVRRFQIDIQIDLLLILKLAAVIFLFNHDGSRQRLIVLIIFASVIYLYQTGALAPVIRWLSQGMQRGAAPQRPRPAVRAENLPPAAGGQENENMGIPERQPAGENGNEQVNDGNRAIEEAAGQGEAEAEAEAEGNRWWRIAKEIQLIVFGFITSLLPGFHNID